MHQLAIYGMTFGREREMEPLQEEKIPQAVGPYEILKSLGKGGMGEVFLAKDPSCGRSVALKRIRPEMQLNKTLQNRFLREATVASFLSHPSIVPILAIQTMPPEIYYTMPFVEGETLRQILRSAKEGEERARSIPALARIFLQVCEALAYTHSKGILHRDLKPENIIVGKYGEVMILDWGIADFIEQIQKEEPLSKKHLSPQEDLTKPGKIAGTLAYMAPERLQGKSSSVQTDIYALGVILYQLLTLQLPFQRKTISAFRKQADKEELIDPLEMAPYRDIPHPLAAVCVKCLARKEEERYQSVGELIAVLKNYIEGKPEWIFVGKLDLQKENDWQFQENILLAKHIAITKNLDVTQWAALMISRRFFSNNLRLETEIEMGPLCEGIGFLLCVPDADERKSLEEGYCLWIGSQKHPSSRLFRNNIQVLELAGLYLTPHKRYQLQIEKGEDYLKLFIDKELKLYFTSRFPLAGKYVGFLHKDGDFSMQALHIFDGSHTATVNCLAVPNAFLSHKLYDLALQEYRQIGQCFPGRMEGREALFRAGLTLLEKGRVQKEEKFFHLALKEFEKLYRTSGAPLEYLGKSLVYSALGDSEEEAKCLELGLRKFPKHPLLPMLKEHIAYRMHESSLNNRQTAYRILLLSIRHIPNLFDNPDTRALIESLQQNWETLSFIEKDLSALEKEGKFYMQDLVAIELAFWLGKIPILKEMAEEMAQAEDDLLLANALFAMAELDALEQIEPFLIRSSPRIAALKLLFQPLAKLPSNAKGGKPEYRTLHFLIRQAMREQKWELVLKTIGKLKRHRLPKEEQIAFDAWEIWCHLVEQRPSLAGAILRKYPSSTLTQETSPLHFPYGTWLYATQGPKAAAVHFSSVLETPHPPTTALPSHFLLGRIDEKKGWIERAFRWEKKELHRQLELFYRAIGKKR